MDFIALQLCYDGWWETLANDRTGYVNAKNTSFLIRKDCTFEQFLVKVYEVLQINPNEYSRTMKTTLRSSNTMYRACSLPMDIFNDEMVKVVLYMASNVVNYGCIPIFLSPHLLEFRLKILRHLWKMKLRLEQTSLSPILRKRWYHNKCRQHRHPQQDSAPVLFRSWGQDPPRLALNWMAHWLKAGAAPSKTENSKYKKKQTYKWLCIRFSMIL